MSVHPNTKWLGDKLWYLVNLPSQERYNVFCDQLGYSRDTIKAKRKLKLKEIRAGKLMPPRRPKNYEIGQSPEQIAEQIEGGKLGKIATQHMIDEETRTAIHEQIDEAIDEYNVNPQSISSVKITGGEHTGYIKNSDNEIEYTDPLKRKGFSFSIETDRLKPLWEPVKRIESVRLPKKEKVNPSDTQKAVILSDLQYPYGDEKAIEVALQITRDVKPDKIVLVGDLLDLASWGKYEQRPEYAAQTQEAVIQAHQLLATLRKMCPTAEIAVLAGNHDQRMEKSILNNAMHAYGLRRADQPENWPVMSVPYLCAFDTLDVEYMAGYPANRYWINDNLQVRHGQKARSSGSTAKLVSDDERVSTIFGHVHRVETHFKTTQVREGGKTNAAFSIGCLCLIDGSVPSTKSGHKLNGEHVENYEDWQNAIAVVDYETGDGNFNVNTVYINTFNNYRANYNGKVYQAKGE